MDLYNVTTRSKESIDDPEALQQAVLSGTHAFSQGSNVFVRSPDGKAGTIPAEQAIEAIKSGYQIETNTQRAIREYTEDNSGLLGSLKVGLGQFADEALIGLPELIYDKKADPLDVAKKEALKKEHDLANTLGGLAGFGASFFTGAPLWKAGTKAGEKVAAHIAEKLAVQAGEEVGKRGLKKAATAIASKIGGAATEGAIVTAPHVITELALGDPNAAAETLLSGVGIGSLFGAGQGLGKEFLGLGKKVSDETARIIGETDLNAKKLARKVAQTLTNVSEDDVLYYLKNQDKVNQAPAFEALKDSIDSAYKGFADEAQILKEAYDNAQMDFKIAYQNKRRDMQQARAPQELADELVVALDNQKAVLGEMSERAEQILADSSAFLPKKKILKMIDQVEQKVIPRQIGEEAVRAGEALGKLKNRIDELYPSNLDGNEIREILQQVRKDINYNQLAGEFNDTANRIRKDFTQTVNKNLKKVAPAEYSQIMDEMAQRADSLNRMSKVFGKRETAANRITQLTRPGNQVNKELFDEFSSLTGENFSERLDALIQTKNDLEAIDRGVDLSEKLVPNLKKQRDELEIKVRNAKELVDSLSKINPVSSEQAIRRMGYKNPDINTRRAFEKLEEITGTNFLEQIKNRNILDAFGKQSTQGSRKVNLGAITGGAVGQDWTSALIGGGIGAAMDTYGGRLLKGFIDRNPNFAGLLFVEKAMKKTADDIDRIPGIMERMSSGVKELKKRPLAINALYRLTENEARPERELRQNAGEQLEKVGNQIRAWLADPAMYNNMIGQFTNPLSEGGAPNIAQGLSLGAQKALAYLHQEMPKPPAPSSPFAPKVAWNPSDFELTKFTQMLQVAENPMIVLDLLEDNTLTLNHMDALKNMFPSVYQAVQMKVMETAQNDPKPMAYDERVRLSVLTGVPIEVSLSDENILKLQERYLKGEGDENLQEEPQFSPKQDVKLSKANLTTMQAALM